MQLILLHPQHGYYLKVKRQGKGNNYELNSRDDFPGFISARGDFITSPEVSQLFGEVSDLYLICSDGEHFDYYSY